MFPYNILEMHVDAYDWISALYNGLLIAMLSTPSFDKGPDYLEELPQLMKEGYILAFNKVRAFRTELEVRKITAFEIRPHSLEKQTFLYKASSMTVFFATQPICTFCN